ncbi:coniferyl aldehyde dehydrogenase [Candidatus Sororendozoicomonas aggregata]|uniref:coniferyl aldehyde dehydrogenase n=1 Tax=Candidatus Sororendozoicomonas aggregata TaxID=3073239 RepID=UPI002ED3595A
MTAASFIVDEDKQEKTGSSDDDLISSELTLQQTLQKQQSAFLNNPYPLLDERIAHLKALKQALKENRSAFVDAIDADFGGRARNETLVGEFMPVLENISYTLKRLSKWMKPRRRHLAMQLQPASAKVVFQPLGVVGVVVPWNYPLQLSALPLVTALAAGNRVMIKMSEYTPKTSTLFAEVIARTFPDDLVTVINGDAEVGAAFTRLPFDHVLFTGSTEVGRHVMKAAAENLTPVTLELGGKSPVIINDDFPLDEAAERICFGKSINAGQTCVAPDYILLKESQKEAFVAAYKKAFGKMYPSVNNSKDYSAIVNERQFTRLESALEDARVKGADIRPVTDDKINDGSRRMVPHLILNPTDDMTIMQEEIFGPLLPVVAVDDLANAISFVQARPRPLALYYFGLDKRQQEKVVLSTHAGGVSINDTLTHAIVDDMPFGGIGSSGMGHYHGHEGFLALTKTKSVLSKGKLNSSTLIYPPYTGIKKLVVRFLTGGG